MPPGYFTKRAIWLPRAMRAFGQDRHAWGIKFLLTCTTRILYRCACRLVKSFTAMANHHSYSHQEPIPIAVGTGPGTMVSAMETLCRAVRTLVAPANGPRAICPDLDLTDDYRAHGHTFQSTHGHPKARALREAPAACPEGGTRRSPMTIF